MQTKFILLGLFLIVAAAQLYIPAAMILDKEDILSKGKLYRFKIRPIDPNDPMRGKYIRLWFIDDYIHLPDSIYYERNQKVYIEIHKGDDGFAKIKKVFNKKPDIDLDYLETTINYTSYFKDTTRLTFNYPFDRFYLDEHKAPVAEDVYRESLRDSTKSTWAEVKIKNGKAALKDVMIDGVPIQSIISELQNDFM